MFKVRLLFTSFLFSAKLTGQLPNIIFDHYVLSACSNSREAMDIVT